MENLLKEIKQYNQLDKELEEKNKGIKELSLTIDFKKKTENLTYAETKELKNQLGYRLHSDKNKELEEILKSKKEKEYPEIKGVIYYPKLKELNLEQHILVAIDRNLKHYSGHASVNWYYFIEDIKEYHDLSVKAYKKALTPIVDFLLSHNIIEKKYLLGSNRHISQEEKDRYYAHWSIMPEQLKEMCEEDLENYYSEDHSIMLYDDDNEESDDTEINSIESFEKNLTETRYKIIKKPDYTMDEI